MFFAGYTVLQFIVLATAWNILGGYTGYVNFGSAAFFALGAYTSVFLHKCLSAADSAADRDRRHRLRPVGFGMGYLTLRLRGAFFAIATLALAVVLQTLIVNWALCRRLARRLRDPPEATSHLTMLSSFIATLHRSTCSLLMLVLAVVALTTARADRALARSATASPPSATTNWRRKPPACRR